jgi:hypothetical protein
VLALLDRDTKQVRDPKTGEEYKIHVNTLEGYFSIFKRGTKGVYQHLLGKASSQILSRIRFSL